MLFWGFNYSKMANYRFLIDSTTFWMDFRTSKILIFWTRSGPLNLQITTKPLQQIQEKLWEHFLEI